MREAKWEKKTPAETRHGPNERLTGKVCFVKRSPKTKDCNVLLD